MSDCRSAVKKLKSARQTNKSRGSPKPYLYAKEMDFIPFSEDKSSDINSTISTSQLSTIAEVLNETDTTFLPKEVSGSAVSENTILSALCTT